MKLEKLLVCSLAAGLVAGFFAASPALADDESPFQIQKFNLTPGDPVEVELVEVPRGKRLVMQYVSFNATTLAKDVANVNCRLEVERANTGVGQDPTLWFVVTTSRNLGVTAFDGHLAGGPITFYGEAGDRVVAICDVVGPGFVNSLAATLVGRLVSNDD